jgi:hypothetical protein
MLHDSIVAVFAVSTDRRNRLVKMLFADFVAKGYLPKERAEFCEDEYGQVDENFGKLASCADSAL